MLWRAIIWCSIRQSRRYVLRPRLEGSRLHHHIPSFKAFDWAVARRSGLRLQCPQHVNGSNYSGPSMFLEPLALTTTRGCFRVQSMRCLSLYPEYRHVVPSTLAFRSQPTPFPDTSNLHSRSSIPNQASPSDTMTAPITPNVASSTPSS